MAVRVNLIYLEETAEFPYLGIMVTYNNSDWELLYSHFRKAQKIWGMVSKFLGKKGAPIKAWEMIYKSVFRALLLYDSKLWVVMDVMMMVLEGFCHRTEKRILGMMARRGDGAEWEWSLVDTVMEA